MHCTISVLRKVQAVVVTLSLLSLSVMVYNIIKLIDNEDENKEKANNWTRNNMVYVIMIMATTLTLLVNLLLYQGALDMTSIDLYYWPDPKHCLGSWLLVYGSILVVYLCGMASCFYLAIRGAKEGNIFIEVGDNYVAWGFIYLAGDGVVLLCLYFVMTLYGQI